MSSTASYIKASAKDSKTKTSPKDEKPKSSPGQRAAPASTKGAKIGSADRADKSGVASKTQASGKKALPKKSLLPTEAKSPAGERNKAKKAKDAAIPRSSEGIAVGMLNTTIQDPRSDPSTHPSPSQPAESTTGATAKSPVGGGGRVGEGELVGMEAKSGGEAADEVSSDASGQTITSAGLAELQSLMRLQDASDQEFGWGFEEPQLKEQERLRPEDIASKYQTILVIQNEYRDEVVKLVKGTPFFSRNIPKVTRKSVGSPLTTVGDLVVGVSESRQIVRDALMYVSDDTKDRLNDLTTLLIRASNEIMLSQLVERRDMMIDSNTVEVAQRIQETLRGLSSHFVSISQLADEAEQKAAEFRSKDTGRAPQHEMRTLNPASSFPNTASLGMSVGATMTVDQLEDVVSISGVSAGDGQSEDFRSVQGYEAPVSSRYRTGVWRPQETMQQTQQWHEPSDKTDASEASNLSTTARPSNTPYRPTPKKGRDRDGGDGGGEGGGGGDDGGDEEGTDSEESTITSQRSSSTEGKDQTAYSDDPLAHITLKKKNRKGFSRETHPLTSKQGPKNQAALLKALKQVIKDKEPVIEQLAKAIVDNDRQMSPEVVLQFHKFLDLVITTDTTHIPELSRYALIGLENLSLAVSKSGLFDFVLPIRGHLDEVSVENSKATAGITEVDNILRRLIENKYDPTVKSAEWTRQLKERELAGGAEFTFDDFIDDKKSAGNADLLTFLYDVRQLVQKRLVTAVGLLYTELEKLGKLSDEAKTNQSKQERILSRWGINDTDPDLHYLQDLLDKVHVYKNDEGELRGAQMHGTLVLRELLQTLTRSTISKTARAMSSFMGKGPGVDVSQSYAAIVEWIKSERNAMIGIIGKGDHLDFMATVMAGSAIEAAVTERTEWGPMGKANLDAVRKIMISAERLMPQEQLGEATWKKLENLLDRQVQDTLGLYLKAADEYPQNKNKKTKKAKAGSANSNGGGKQSGQSTPSDRERPAPPTDDEVNLLKHPDSKVVAEAHKLLKEKKKDGTPKLTLEDARKAFDGNSFFKSVTTGPNKRNKLYRSLWKHIDKNRLGGYDARKYALFLILTHIPRDIYAIRIGTRPFAGGAGAEEEEDGGDDSPPGEDDSAKKTTNSTISMHEMSEMSSEDHARIRRNLDALDHADAEEKQRAAKTKTKTKPAQDDDESDDESK